MSKLVVHLADRPEDQKPNLPFSKIKVLDARQDPTSFGFIKYGTTFSKLSFNKSFEETYTDYIKNNYVLSNDTNNLLILIKQFRLSKYADDKGNSDKPALNGIADAYCMLNYF